MAKKNGSAHFRATKDFFELIGEAKRKTGDKTQSDFIRNAVKEKVKRVLPKKFWINKDTAKIK